MSGRSQRRDANQKTEIKVPKHQNRTSVVPTREKGNDLKSALGQLRRREQKQPRLMLACILLIVKIDGTKDLSSPLLLRQSRADTGSGTSGRTRSDPRGR
jgi:hypothetical protein